MEAERDAAELFAQELINVSDIETLTCLLEENLDHKQLSLIILRTIIMFPVRLKGLFSSIYSNVDSFDPIIQEDSNIFQLLVEACQNTELSVEAFDAIFTLLSFHKIGSNEFNAIHTSFLAAAMNQNTGDKKRMKLESILDRSKETRYKILINNGKNILNTLIQRRDLNFLSQSSSSEKVPENTINIVQKIISVL
ncbi:MAG: hypothetical protein EZS28_008585 [Streblomastix strix]|uniref:Uncharacterized protein n=1 Tax=Streblomastix strix TaxID=222440 RepID=A0A5J4WMM6_9EUKA|nr:MAG: hypothetical protein EZS28_008585 [Streblomastix strix]